MDRRRNSGEGRRGGGGARGPGHTEKSPNERDLEIPRNSILFNHLLCGLGPLNNVRLTLNGVFATIKNELVYTNIYSSCLGRLVFFWATGFLSRLLDSKERQAVRSSDADFCSLAKTV